MSCNDERQRVSAPTDSAQAVSRTSGGSTSGLAALSWLSSTGWIRSLPEPCQAQRDVRQAHAFALLHLAAASAHRPSLPGRQQGVQSVTHALL